MRLERLDVRVKLAAFAAVLVAVFVLTDPLANLLLLGLLAGALGFAGMPVRGLWTMLQPLLVVMVLILAVTTLTSAQFSGDGLGQVLFSGWGLSATVGGLLVGVNFVLRIVVMVTATYAFTVSTSTDDLLLVLSRLRAPYWLSILLTTALSFLPTVARRKDLIVEAQRARGAPVKDTGPIGQLLAVVPIMVPLITTSIMLADNLAVAMTNRGYGATNAMTAMHDLRLRTADAWVLVAVVMLLAAVLSLRFGLGWGVL